MRALSPSRLGAALRLGCALLALAVSCSPPPQPVEAPVFFPAAPELPRLQFLTSFSGRNDLEHQSSFDRFVLGAQEDVKVDKPYGVAIHDGKIYVCDTNATVFVFELKEKKFATLAGAVGQGALRQATNIAIAADGTKYVSDPVRGQVVVFDAADKYANALGTPGSWRPVDAAPYEGRLYVVDSQKQVVQVLDPKTGALLRTIGDKGATTERLDRPTNLTFDSEGYLYVTDFGRFQILKFDRDGHFKTAFGSPGDNFGHFARPKGIAVDREGHVYAVDASFNNVQVFSRQGRLLMFFGEQGDKPGAFLLPAKVTIDYQNLDYFKEYLEPGFQPEYLVLVTSQFGERRVNVLAYGHQEGQKYPTEEELLKRIDERKQKELQTPP